MTNRPTRTALFRRSSRARSRSAAARRARLGLRHDGQAARRAEDAGPPSPRPQHDHQDHHAPARAIVTTTYRYKRPPRKRKAMPLRGPAIVRKRGKVDAVVPPDRVEEPAPANDNRPETSTSMDPPKSAIVTVKRPGRFGDVPDMTPEEHRQRGDAADALFRKIVRLATE
jgi:hypothetical protein